MSQGGLAAQVVQFARTLRAAGLPLGPGRVLDAVGAAAEVGLGRREDLYFALHATLVSRAEHRALFDQAFRLFWQEPQAVPAALAALLPQAPRPAPPPPPIARRLAEALAPARPAPRAPRAPALEVEAHLAWSDREVLRTKDFEEMSAEEVREAERAIARLRLEVRELKTRRLRPDPRGERVDLRATLRATARAGRAGIALRWRSATSRPPAVVGLCDISGSMARYSRMLLRFLHALARDREHVHSFTFATHLTNVTRLLRHRDVDLSLAAVGKAVSDWEGGTRIGACLREFNLRWARRLLGQGASVLLITDGLDREDAHRLAEESERLRRSCRRLIWLNPLLRFAGFEPRAAGIRALLPHVDEFRPVHDLSSLEGLAAALSGPATRGRAGTGSPARRRAR
ncbi:MAG TPA: VWA domain-containing protein [Anaeromyxobacteraceae bacterium]|nr:VWA domain-containing protein [Anaeromyxobacteraceae bacterium]